MEFFSPPYFSIGNFELNLGSPRNTIQPAAAVVEGMNSLVPRTYFFDWEKMADGAPPMLKPKPHRWHGMPGPTTSNFTDKAGGLSIWI